MNIAQLLTAPIVAPIVAPRTVRPSKAKAKAKPVAKIAVPSPKALEIEALRVELSALTGAPCSPMMGVESLTKAIAKAKLPVEPEIEAEDEVLSTEPKARVIPAKAQGIGAHCVSLLKGGMLPKAVLMNVLITFPEAKTSMACVYWYASKIKQGLL